MPEYYEEPSGHSVYGHRSTNVEAKSMASESTLGRPFTSVTVLFVVPSPHRQLLAWWVWQ